MRLIDADAVRTAFPPGEYVRTECVRATIDHAPTIDAAPVLRCKDCKYYLRSNEKCQLIDTRLHFYETDNMWTEESFCPWGERKDGDDK